jgi:hypothetical protein
VSDIELARSETLARLAQCREELRQTLASPPEPDGIERAAARGAGGEFPRSRTMKAIFTGRGIGTVGALIGGLIMARPELALRLLRMIPTGAIARLLAGKVVSALKSRRGRGAKR